jgi:hypothetical protein
MRWHESIQHICGRDSSYDLRLVGKAYNFTKDGH